MPGVQLICHEDKPDGLLTKLAAHALDLVLTDTPISTHTGARVYSHRLGRSELVFCAAPELAARCRKQFPRCLDGMPFLLPLEGSVTRRALDQWFDQHNIRPTIAGEFQDSALLKVFGQAGAGIFVVPAVVERAVRKTYGVQVIGRAAELAEEVYAISMERKLKHPAVVALTLEARERLFDAGRH
jgi:LysR family transcriptional activator of nhaA